MLFSENSAPPPSLRASYATALAQMFPCEFREISKNIFSYRTPPVAASKYDYCIFVDLEKVVDTVDDNVSLGKLTHQGIRDLTYTWFEFYLKERKQYVSANRCNSK